IANGDISGSTRFQTAARIGEDFIASEYTVIAHRDSNIAIGVDPVARYAGEIAVHIAAPVRVLVDRIPDDGIISSAHPHAVDIAKDDVVDGGVPARASAVQINTFVIVGINIVSGEGVILGQVIGI